MKGNNDKFALVCHILYTSRYLSVQHSVEINKNGVELTLRMKAFNEESVYYDFSNLLLFPLRGVVDLYILAIKKKLEI